MTRTHPNILAINPGSKYIGFAVFEGAELRDWGIKIINACSLKEKRETVKAIISDFIDRYGINTLVIKQLHPSRSSANLNKLVDSIKELAASRAIKIRQYPLEKLESLFTDAKTTNKMNLAEIIVHLYPFLSLEFEKEKTNHNPYHIRMFEAVALGLVCLNRTEKLLITVAGDY